MAALVRRGAWATGHVGLNQVLVAATVILAGRIEGGVIAYQTAFTFFLLPHALLAHPIFTALYPRLAAAGAGRSDLAGFAGVMSRGLRTMTALTLPAAALMAAVAGPALSLVRVGAFDSAGAKLVETTLVAYLSGLTAYSAMFLLTRASYALDDARQPTVVNLWVTVTAVAAMTAVSTVVEGPGLLVAFGLITAVTSAAGTVALHRHVKRLIGMPLPVGRSIVRSVGVAAAGGITAWAMTRLVSRLDETTSMVRSIGELSAGVTVGLLVVVGAFAVMGSEDVAPVADLARRMARRALPGVRS